MMDTVVILTEKSNCRNHLLEVKATKICAHLT